MHNQVRGRQDRLQSLWSRRIPKERTTTNQKWYTDTSQLKQVARTFATKKKHEKIKSEYKLSQDTPRGVHVGWKAGAVPPDHSRVLPPPLLPVQIKPSDSRSKRDTKEGIRKRGEGWGWGGGKSSAR